MLADRRMIRSTMYTFRLARDHTSRRHRLAGSQQINNQRSRCFSRKGARNGVCASHGFAYETGGIKALGLTMSAKDEILGNDAC